MARVLENIQSFQDYYPQKLVVFGCHILFIRGIIQNYVPENCFSIQKSDKNIFMFLLCETFIVKIKLLKNHT